LKDTRGVAIDHEFTERTTFIVTPDLKVAATLSTNDDKITPAQHVDRALAVVQQLAARR
jgi:peroxiredoxin